MNGLQINQQKRDTIETWKQRGNDAFKVKDYNKALDCYTQGIKVCGVPSARNDSRNELVGVLFSNRSACHLELGNAPVALKEAESAITFRPEWFRGYVRKAAAHEALGESKEAIRECEMALRLEPGCAEAQERKARLQPQQQYRSNAPAAAAAAAPSTTASSTMGQSSPSSSSSAPPPSPSQCATGKDAKEHGNKFFKEGDFITAEKYYTKAIDLAAANGGDGGENGVYYSNRAACYQNLHEYSTALKDSNRALAVSDPNTANNTKALLRRANAHEGLKNWSEALHDYEELRQKQGCGIAAPSTQQHQSVVEGAERCRKMMS